MGKTKNMNGYKSNFLFLLSLILSAQFASTTTTSEFIGLSALDDNTYASPLQNEDFHLSDGINSYAPARVNPYDGNVDTYANLDYVPAEPPSNFSVLDLPTPINLKPQPWEDVARYPFALEQNPDDTINAKFIAPDHTDLHIVGEQVPVKNKTNRRLRQLNQQAIR